MADGMFAAALIALTSVPAFLLARSFRHDRPRMATVLRLVGLAMLAGALGLAWAGGDRTRTLAVAVAMAESRLDRLRNSPKGARGPMQLIPETAARFGVTDICDPEENIDAGVRYLRELSGEFRNPLLIAAAYNAGEENDCVGSNPCSNDKPANLRGIRCGQQAAGFGCDGDGLGEGGATSQRMENVVNASSCAGCNRGI